MTSYELAKQISTMPGSVREIARATGKSKSFIGHLRKAWESSSVPLLNGWRDGTIPFNVVKILAAKSGLEQTISVRQYLATTKNGTRMAKSRARVELGLTD